MTPAPIPSFAAAIAPPCQCPHTQHLFDQDIACGGIRIPLDGITYCYACWAAVYEPSNLIALGDRGLRILDFSRLEDMYQEGQIDDRAAWGACGVTFDYGQENPDDDTVHAGAHP